MISQHIRMQNSSKGAIKMGLHIPASAHEGRVALAAGAGEGGVEAVARAVLRPGTVGAQVARVALRALLALVRPALSTTAGFTICAFRMMPAAVVQGGTLGMYKMCRFSGPA